MERRTFLIRGGTVLLTLPVGWAIAGCERTPVVANVMTTNLRFTSSVTNGHMHDITISMIDLAQPPESNGISENTTTVEGHQHTVSLSEAETRMIEDNRAVIKNTSVAEGHMHMFQFSLTGGIPTTSSETDGGGNGGAGGGAGTVGGKGAAGKGGMGSAGRPGG